MQYWLFKSEPTAFSLTDLMKSPKQTSPWDGVRNYQARNMMRDKMQLGDLGFFYHSNCQTPGIVGIVEVVKTSHPDVTAFNPESKYYDPKSTVDKPRWYLVDVRFIRKLERSIHLEELRTVAALKDMIVLRKGNRLSITPVTKMQWETILKLEKN